MSRLSLGVDGQPEITPRDRFRDDVRGKEMNRILSQVEDINDSIVPDTSTKTIGSLQPMMRKGSETRAYLIDLRFETCRRAAGSFRKTASKLA